MEGKVPYYKLFLSTFQISACTFGGGYVIVPLMRKKFVEDLQWIEEEEMLDLIAIAQSTPGAMAINTSILVGYRVRGLAGGLLTVLGTVLPPLLIISIVSLFYQAFRDNAAANIVMRGMLAGIAAVICDVVLKMGSGIVRQKRVLPTVVMLLAFIAVRFLHIGILWIIFLCAAVGAVDTLLRRRREKGGMQT